MNEWTSYERVAAIFEHELADRVPKYEGSIEIPELDPVMDGQLSCSAFLFFTVEQFGFFHRHPLIFRMLKGLLNHPRLISPIAKRAPKIVSKLQRQYSYDMFAYTGGIPMVFNKRIFEDFHISEDGRVIKGPDNRLVWRTSPDGAHTRHGFLRDAAEWEKYMEFDADHKGNIALVNGAEKTCKKLDIIPVYSMFGGCAFEELSSIFGFETLFKFLMKEKGFIKKVVGELNDYSIAVAEEILELGGKYLYITNDIGYKGRTMISPRMFREIFKPGIARFCNKVHEYDAKVIMHSCGFIEDLLPDFVDMGIDALHPIERAAGNDIVTIHETYGNQLILIGNVPIPLLTHGTPEETYNYVKHLLQNVSNDGNHILSSSHSVTQWCKLANFEAYQQAHKDFGNYPIEKQ